MSPQTLERLSTDWFDIVKQKLDELQHDCLEVEDKRTVPADARFEQARFEVEKLHRLTGFPNLPESNVWLGPAGEIGITWRFRNRALELLFADSMYARVYDGTEQARLRISDVPRILAKLVKGAA